MMRLANMGITLTQTTPKAILHVQLEIDLSPVVCCLNTSSVHSLLCSLVQTIKSMIGYRHSACMLLAAMLCWQVGVCSWLHGLTICPCSYAIMVNDLDTVVQHAQKITACIHISMMICLILCVCRCVFVFVSIYGDIWLLFVFRILSWA